MKKLHLIVSGRVQGVGFRYGTMQIAQDLGGIFGRVWNNDDGTVEIYAQSSDSLKLAQFVQEIRKGPTPFSKVTYVDAHIGNFKDYHDFKMAN